MIGKFPFGEEVRKVEQQDRTPKQVFILGVYASAVHAQWLDKDGRTVVKALAVASEPYIFWRGEGAGEIIEKIKIPPELGKLDPAAKQFNGPSGIALDELIIKPLGMTREDTWLCDLVPHSCMNPAQKKTIEKNYLPLVDKYGLPLPTVPPVPSKLTDQARREEILNEIEESQAEVLVLLGDKPIQWFLKYYVDTWKRLSDFPEYGQLYPIEINGRSLEILPLAHPRQIAKLGRSSQKWYDLHQAWLDQTPLGIIE
jgi:uracil-DNA glycosylase